MEGDGQLTFNFDKSAFEDDNVQELNFDDIKDDDEVLEKTDENSSSN